MPEITVNPNAKITARQSADIDNVNLQSAINRLKNAMASLEELFVNRTEEIAGLTLAIAASQHILFEGPAGVAKSDLARECFSRITGEGLVVYDKMFGRGTKEDDVFGPVDMVKYREQAEWSHNTTGSLPSCHFANLEELGRASDLLLPSMMTVLNERLFHNGSKVLTCPLITAVASTNFLTESDELAAFNDRWLVRMLVNPLDSNQKCLEMMTRSMQPRPKPKAVVSLNEIIAINRRMRELPVDPEVLPLYVDLVKQYQKANTTPTIHISDRRLVHAFRLARASAVMDERESVSVDDLAQVKFGISLVGKDDESIFMNVLQKIVGSATEIKKEAHELNLMSKFLKKITDEFDPKLAKSELKRLLSDTNKLVGGMRARTKAISMHDHATKFQEILESADVLQLTIQESLNNRS